MKKIILIALALMLAVGFIFAVSITASASEEATENLSENNTVAEPYKDLGRITVNAADLGLDYYEIWNTFPAKIDLEYGTDKFYVADMGFTAVSFYSHSVFEEFPLTLVDGKWESELPENVLNGGGVVYAYIGVLEGLYRGGTKEAVCINGEDEFGSPYMVEIMSHLFRIWTLRYIGYDTVVADAYYTFDGELEYLVSSKSIDGGYRLDVYYNAEREITMVSDGWNYMLPDGNWYAGTSTDTEPREALERFAGMSFEEFSALVPCLIYCGDHKLTEYSCELGQYCTDCIEMTQPIKYHDWKEATCQAPRTCKDCGTTDGYPYQHNYDVSCIPAGCETNGYTVYTCSDCGDSFYGEEFKAFGHTYDTIVTEPTCNDGGYTTYLCCNCGDSYIADETDALGHDWVDADCTYPKNCVNCGETEGDVAHSWIDATYEAPKTCGLCGETDGEPLVSEEETTEEAIESEETDEQATESILESEAQKATEASTAESAESAEETSRKKNDNDEDHDAIEQGGCNGVIGGATAIVAIVVLSGAVLMKKKDKE